MDRIGASFNRTFEEIKRRLRANPVALQIPIGEGSTSTGVSFEGVIDLIKMKSLYYDKESMGANFEVRDIADEYLEEAREWRSKMLEAVAELDEKVLEQYYETEDIPEEDLLRLLREATLRGDLQPTFCGSSLNFIGVQRCWMQWANFCPVRWIGLLSKGLILSPKSGVVKLENRNRGRLQWDEPMCGLVFKIQTDKHGDLCFIRVYSGQLKSGTRLLNARTGKKELISQLLAGACRLAGKS